MPVWRRDDAGQSYALKLTAAGLKAIAVDDGSEEATAPRESAATATRPNPDATKASGPDVIGERAKTLTPRAGSKLARVIDLLQRSEGATILELDRSNGMAAAHDPGGAHRAAQARICRRPRTDRRGRFDLPHRGPRCGRRRSLRRRAAKRRSAATASVSRRRTERRDRHGSQASHVRTGGEAAGEDSAGRLRCRSMLQCSRSWRVSRVTISMGCAANGAPIWAASRLLHLPRWLLMRVLAYRLQADAFGGLDKSIQRMLRSDKDEGRRRSLRPARASDPRRRRPEGRRAAGARVEGQARAGHDPRGRLRLERPDLRQPVPDRQGDDRNELERSSLLRPSAGKDRCGG